MKNIFIYLTIVSLFFSCHNTNSNEDLLNHDNNLIDSVKKATAEEVANKLEIEQKNNLRIKLHDSLVTDCNTKITKLISEIELQNFKMRDIQSFHFLRTSAEKEIQMRNQLNLINNLNLRLLSLKDSLHFFDTNY